MQPPPLYQQSPPLQQQVRPGGSISVVGGPPRQAPPERQLSGQRLPGTRSYSPLPCVVQASPPPLSARPMITHSMSSVGIRMASPVPERSGRGSQEPTIHKRSPSFVGLPYRAPSPSPQSTQVPAASPPPAFAMRVAASPMGSQTQRLFTVPSASFVPAMQACPSFVPSESSTRPPPQGTGPASCTAPPVPMWAAGAGSASILQPRQGAPRTSAPSVLQQPQFLQQQQAIGSYIPPPANSGQTQSLSWVPPSEPSWVLQMEVAQQFVAENSHLNAVVRSRSWEPPTSRDYGRPGASFLEDLDITGIGDEEDDEPTPLCFVSGSASRQHPVKRQSGIVNADAVEEGRFHVGICDGVSGVHHLGLPVDALPRDLLRSCRAVLESDFEAEVDASRCSRRLSAAGAGARRDGRGGTRGRRASTGQVAKRGTADNGEQEDDGTWLVSVIQRAYEATEAFGATTLLLAALRGSDLVAACLGDCALLVLRPLGTRLPIHFSSIFKTEPGRYDSRRPVQVQRLQGFSSSHAHAVIQGAMVSTTPVQPGDVLIMGSDGIFDNLGDNDIIHAIEHYCSTMAPPGTSWPLPQTAVTPHHLRGVASALVDLAISRVRTESSENTQHIPWSAQGEVPANNADDTTAVVAIVTEDGVTSGHERRPSEVRQEVVNNRIYDVVGPTVLQDRTNTAAVLSAPGVMGCPPKAPIFSAPVKGTARTGLPPPSARGGRSLGGGAVALGQVASPLRGRAPVFDGGSVAGGAGVRSASAEASLGAGKVPVPVDVQTARGPGAHRYLRPPPASRGGSGAQSHRELHSQQRRDECVIA